MFAALCVYALAGAAVGALLGAFDPNREHESAILSSVVGGPFGIFALMVVAKDDNCVRLGGAPGSSCPDQAYFDVVSGAIPLLGAVAAAIGMYFAVSDHIVARRKRST